MAVSITVTTDINIPRYMDRIQDPTFWKFAATQWHKHYAPYVPMDTGTLYEQVVITPGQIEHTVPYAKPNYFKNRNFRTDRHPLATKEWDKAAAITQTPYLIQDMQGYIDSGRLNLSG